MARVARHHTAKPTLMLAIGWLSSIPAIACAMDFKSITVPQGGIAITADGPIVSGDDARLINLLKSIPKSQFKQIRGIALNSDGGSPFVRRRRVRSCPKPWCTYGGMITALSS